MTDIRIVSARTEITQIFEVDVEDWFSEFQHEWLEYDNTDRQTVDELREKFIKETAHELALDGSLGNVQYEDHDMDVDIWRKK